MRKSWRCPDSEKRSVRTTPIHIMTFSKRCQAINMCASLSKKCAEWVAPINYPVSSSRKPRMGSMKRHDQPLTDARLKAELERCEYCEEKPCRDRKSTRLNSSHL